MADLQLSLLDKILKRLAPGGFLIIGKHECIPEGCSHLQMLSPCIYKKIIAE